MVESLTACDWVVVGNLSANTQLYAGDVVEVEFFDCQGKVDDLCFRLMIESDLKGEPQSWARDVANHINTHIPLVKAGKSSEQGFVVAYRGNQIFASADSGITEVTLNYRCVAKQTQAIQENTSQGYDYIYPVNHEHYKSGDRVLHVATGKIYIAKAWPYTELCRLGGVEQANYEPGVGLNWQLAWLEQSS